MVALLLGPAVKNACTFAKCIDTRGPLAAFLRAELAPHAAGIVRAHGAMHRLRSNQATPDMETRIYEVQRETERLLGLAVDNSWSKLVHCLGALVRVEDAPSDACKRNCNPHPHFHQFDMVVFEFGVLAESARAWQASIEADRKAARAAGMPAGAGGNRK